METYLQSHLGDDDIVCEILAKKPNQPVKVCQLMTWSSFIYQFQKQKNLGEVNPEERDEGTSYTFDQGRVKANFPSRYPKAEGHRPRQVYSLECIGWLVQRLQAHWTLVGPEGQ